MRHMDVVVGPAEFVGSGERGACDARVGIEAVPLGVGVVLPLIVGTESEGVGPFAAKPRFSEREAVVLVIFCADGGLQGDALAVAARNGVPSIFLEELSRGEVVEGDAGGEHEAVAP